VCVCVCVIHTQVLKCLLCLRIKEVDMKKDTEDTAPKKKFMLFKERKTSLSRMQRKVRTEPNVFNLMS